jgi:cytochrome c2
MLQRCTRALPSAFVLFVAIACARAGGSADSPGVAPQPPAASEPATVDEAAGNPPADEAAANPTTDDGTGTGQRAGNAVGAGAATSTTAAADTSGLDPRIALGLATYRHQYCGICHRLDAAGTRGVFGPEHNGIGARAEQRIHDPDYTGAATTAAAYLRESIVDPNAYIVPGYEFTRHRMPPYTALDDAELDALVQMLLAQK